MIKDEKNKKRFASWVVASFSLIILSVCLALLREYNSDDIYLYSQAIDLFKYGNLKGWSYSAVPFTFPDLFLAVPAALVTHDPFLFHLVTSSFFLVFFAILYFAIKPRAEDGERDIWPIAFAVAAILVCFVGLVLFKKPWYFLIEPMFILDHHGGAAISALLVFAWLRQESTTTASKVGISVLILVLTASDFFFAFYLCFMLLFNVKKASISSVLVLGLVFVQAVFVFWLSWVLNPSLAVQAHSSSHPLPLSARLDAIKHVSAYCAIILVGWFAGASRNQQIRSLAPYVLGSICAAIVAASVGLISNVYTYRYATIVAPVAILVLSELIFKIADRNRLWFSAFALVAPCLTLIFIAPKSGVASNQNYKPEIECLRQYAAPGSMLIAEYWPAKVVFEKSGRLYNLYQINPDGKEETWIYNKKWRHIYPEGVTGFVIMQNLSEAGRKFFLSRPNSSLICDGRILRVILKGDGF